jgi:hypothetical protein
MGAAATAGVAVTGSVPAGAARQPDSAGALALNEAAAPSLAMIAASDVSVVPAGELIDTDVQAVLQALDRRLAKAHLIDDLQVAMTLVDDFMGNSAATGTIGQLGWSLGAGATGTAVVGVVVDQPGIFTIGTGTTATGWQNLNLGNNNLRGGPVLMCEWRLKVTALNNATDQCSWWFGVHNNLAGAEPTTGFYFRYTPGDGTSWQAVCANGGARTVVSCGKTVDTSFHRFRITCDGAGIARFYIDSLLVATITTSVPTTNRYSPAASLRKSTGTAARGAVIDYFALRYEYAR